MDITTMYQFMFLSLFLIGFSVGTVVGRLFERYNNVQHEIRYLKEMASKIVDKKADTTIGTQVPFNPATTTMKEIKEKKIPLSRVMHNPTPEEVRKERDRKAMAEQLETMTIEKRESGSGPIVL